MKYWLSLFLVVVIFFSFTMTTTVTAEGEQDMVVVDDTNNNTRRGRRIVGRIREGVAVDELSAPSVQGQQSTQQSTVSLNADEEQNEIKTSEKHAKQILSMGVRMASGLLKSAKMFGVGLPVLDVLDDVTIAKQFVKIYQNGDEEQITKTTTSRPTNPTTTSRPTTTITTTITTNTPTTTATTKPSPFPCGGVQFKWSVDPLTVRTANVVTRVALSLANQARCSDLSDDRCLFGYKNSVEEIYFNSESDHWEVAVPPQSIVVSISPTGDETNVYGTGSADWTAVGGSSYIEDIIAINCVQ
eukprot:GHVS01081392.1.p1 GENE.GHVS01081392.1~~GHVS01081392.1.p1  ORF type:complete len:300 (+),score=57.04 GHVS01081392.1:455-1354(+)